MMAYMIITTQNAWVYETGFVLGATALISLLQIMTWAVLNNILWIYSIVEVSFFYVEYFLVQGEILKTVSERSIFLGMDFFLIFVSMLPLAANMFWIVPDALWGFAQKYVVDEAQDLQITWLKINLSPFYYVPFITSIHILFLSLIRFVLNLGVLLKVLIQQGQLGDIMVMSQFSIPGWSHYFEEADKYTLWRDS